MKKLNNKGWGLGVFIIFLFIFFLAILTIAYLANKNGIGPQETDNNYNNPYIQTYKSYERTVKQKAREYQETNYPNIEEGDIFYINIKKLDLNYSIKSDCTGYVKLGKKHNIYIYEPYLNCGRYMTKGYSKDLDN